MKILNVGVIGAGIVGSRRAEIVAGDKRSKLVAVADVDAGRAAKLAGRMGCAAAAGMEVAAHKDIHIVIVATPHQFLPVYALAALKAGKHVLCEKPMGRNAGEVRKLVEAARKFKVALKPGFNHRYHPAIRKAHEIAERGDIGRIFLMRCRYGHGGRPGYELEWRGNKNLAGGGELLDQGIHALDLFRWFAGDFSEVFGWTATHIWNISPLEDNALALLKTSRGAVASLHASWTQWKNIFSFEIFGRDGYLTVEGLGGSYGAERLTIGRRRPESGPPIEKRMDFSGPDTSWQDEWADFAATVRGARQAARYGEDGLAAVRLVDAIYVSARKNRPVRISKERGAG